MEHTAKIYVAGHRGMVGSALERKLRKEGYNNIVTRTSSELDLRNQQAVNDFFEKAYYSHKVGMRKPNADIFEFVLEDANINAEETLFIDDTKINIDTATRLGFKTHLLLPEERIELLTYY